MPSESVLGEEHIKVLRTIQRIVSKDAIIAGGAVRDQIMGKPFSDIDIWAPTLGSRRNQAKLLQYSLPRALGFRDEDSIIEQPRKNGHTNSSPGHLSLVVERTLNMRYKGDQYQLVMIYERDPTEFVKKYFDLGFCQVWHDGEQAVTTEPFEKDKKERTLTLDKGRMKKDAFDYILSNRIPKLQKKYPDFRVVVVGEHKKESKSKYDTYTTKFTFTQMEQAVPTPQALATVRFNHVTLSWENIPNEELPFMPEGTTATRVLPDDNPQGLGGLMLHHVWLNGEWVYPIPE